MWRVFVQHHLGDSAIAVFFHNRSVDVRFFEVLAFPSSCDFLHVDGRVGFVDDFLSQQRFDDIFQGHDARDCCLLGDDFFLDTITYQGGEEEGSRGSVAVGKYVTPDVFVQYRQGLSADQPSELEASYEINKNIRIQTNVGNEKTTGIDVFWGIDF